MLKCRIVLKCHSVLKCHTVLKCHSVLKCRCAILTPTRFGSRLFKTVSLLTHISVDYLDIRQLLLLLQPFTILLQRKISLACRTTVYYIKLSFCYANCRVDNIVRITLIWRIFLYLKARLLHNSWNQCI